MDCCRLCLRERQLRNSHIIPEFFYKPLYKELNKAHRYSVLSTNHHEKNRVLQKGIREKLLCDECEQKIGSWEKYVSQVFYGGILIKVWANDRNAFVIGGIDYAKFKLFQLSIIWRASVASKAPFAKLKLGPHESKIHQMIRNENPGEPHEYGCILIMLMDQSRPVDSLIIEPEELEKHKGHRVFRFIFGGLMWLYVVSSHTFNYDHRDFFMGKDGTLTIYKEKFENIKFIREYAKKLLLAGKLNS